MTYVDIYSIPVPNGKILENKMKMAQNTVKLINEKQNT